MVRIGLDTQWRLRGKLVERQLFALLRAVREHGSLLAAAREIEFSYRHVWDLLRRWESALGQPLAHLERGRGARLTDFGVTLLAAEERARQRLAPLLDEVASQLERELASAAEAKPVRLLIHASHDLALAQLRDASGGELDLHFHGSMENLAALSRGQCDLAGFHVAEQAPTPELSRWLKAGVHKLIGVAVREQGLMVARENPLRIQGLRDLVRSGVRMVNRQQGSGTRLVFDELLDAAGIERDRLRGYQVEEFTHLAVAATVASGMADAGFGIRAAAAQSGLGFIPLASERYLLACRGDRLQLPELRKFIALLRSARFGTILSRLPGYDNAITGRVTDVAHGLAGPRPARNAAPASK